MDAEDAFSVGPVYCVEFSVAELQFQWSDFFGQLLISSVGPKGSGNLPPSFEKLIIPAPHIRDISVLVN
jgi:hypothetical protein